MRVSGVARLANMGDGRAILEVAGQRLFELNRAAVSIWEKLEAGLPIQDIKSQVATEFGIPVQRAASDVEQFVEVLKDRLLLSDSD